MPEFVGRWGTIYYRDRSPVRPSGDSTPDEPPTVVLLHNFMSTGRMAWGSIADDLAGDYRVVLPDLPGHGKSRGHLPAFAHREMAAELAALLHALGVTRPHMVGCSAGGMIAAWMIEERLADPATLTLVSSTYSVNPATTGIEPDLRPESFRAGPTWLESTARLHDEHQGAGYFDGTLLPAFRALTPQTALDLSLARLANWALPVCLIHGAQDEIFPVELAHQMHDVLPDSELHVVPEQGHALLFRRTRVVGELLRDFLARRGG